MEEIAKGFVGHEVVLDIATIAGSFRKHGVIVGVQNGIIRLKGPSGMETSVPLGDRWMRVEGISAKDNDNE